MEINNFNCNVNINNYSINDNLNSSFNGKRCSKCNEYKSFTEFHRDKNKKDGYLPSCKICRRIYAKNYNSNEEVKLRRKKTSQQYYNYNKEKINDYNKNYHETHKDISKEYQHSYYINNLDRIKERSNSNKEHRKAYMRQWYEINREFFNKQRRERYSNDLKYRLKQTLCNRLNVIIHGYSSIKLKELLGIEFYLFLKWLEFQFYDSMSFENYGIYWHVDHTNPCNNFDLTKLTEQRECFNWVNLRPLTAVKNCSKQDKYYPFLSVLQEVKAHYFLKNFVNIILNKE